MCSSRVYSLLQQEEVEVQRMDQGEKQVALVLVGAPTVVERVP
jgi:hypothetical protein